MKKTLSTLFVAGALITGGSAQAELTWSIFADQTATSSPTSEARSLRAIAINPQSDLLYGSFINGSSSHAVKQYDADTASVAYGNVLDSFATSTGGSAAKAIAADDRGIVYTGRPDDGSAQIRIFDANDSFNRLSSVEQSSFGHTKTVNGMKAVKSGSDYLLYTTGSSSSSGFVNRWNVTTAASPVADTAFDTDGRIDLTGIAGASNATYLRGIDVASDGTLFTASLDNGYVHRIESDFSSAISASITRAHDVALFGGNLYVATDDGANSRVHVLDADTLDLIEVLDPLGDMGLSHATTGGFSGIEIDKDGLIYVSDQYYTSTATTLSDRILVSSAVPEPSSLALLGLGGLIAMRRRRG